MKKMTKRFSGAAATVLALSLVSSSAVTAADGNKCGGANVAVANVEDSLLIHSGADDKSPVIGYVPGAAGVIVTSVDGQWTKIQSGDLTGYVKTGYLAFDDEAEALKEIYGVFGAVAVYDDVKIFADHEDMTSVIGTLGEGEGYEVLGSSEDWVEIMLASGETAYVAAEDVEMTLVLETPVALDEAADAAKVRKTDSETEKSTDKKTDSDAEAEADDSGKADADTAEADPAAGTEEYEEGNAVQPEASPDDTAEAAYYDEAASGDYTEDTYDYTAASNDYTEDTYNYTADAYSYTADTYDYTADTYNYTADAYSYTADTYDYTADTYNYTADASGYTEQAYTAQTEAAYTDNSSYIAPAQETSSELTASDVNSKDLDLLAALIYCEAGNQSEEGKIAVGQVVMNRVESSSFANSINDVIYESGQFTPAGSGWLDEVIGNAPSECYDAALAAMNGEGTVGDALYFNTGSGKGTKIGDHQFY